LDRPVACATWAIVVLGKPCNANSRAAGYDDQRASKLSTTRSVGGWA
jgi:hypothetical protein